MRKYGLVLVVLSVGACSKPPAPAGDKQAIGASVLVEKLMPFMSGEMAVDDFRKVIDEAKAAGVDLNSEVPVSPGLSLNLLDMVLIKENNRDQMVDILLERGVVPSSGVIAKHKALLPASLTKKLREAISRADPALVQKVEAGERKTRVEQSRANLEKNGAWVSASVGGGGAACRADSECGVAKCLSGKCGRLAAFSRDFRVRDLRGVSGARYSVIGTNVWADWPTEPAESGFSPTSTTLWGDKEMKDLDLAAADGMTGIKMKWVFADGTESTEKVVELPEQ